MSFENINKGFRNFNNLKNLPINIRTNYNMVLLLINEIGLPVCQPLKLIYLNLVRNSNSKVYSI